jgi:hypothetical protein
MNPGIHTGVPSAIYHSDPCDTPSLSSGIAKLLLERPPYWAWSAHPKLNPDYTPSEPKSAFDIGSAAHALLLEEGAGVEEVHADNWLTKDAKAQRDELRSRGITPILTKDFERTLEMSRVATEFLKYHNIDVSKTDNECTMITEVDGVLCRTRADIYIPGRIIDYKTTGMNLDVFNKSASKFGYDLQAAMYSRVAAELGERCEWLFLVQETVEPYPVQLFKPTLDFMEVGKRKFEKALMIWSECMMYENWPGYDRTFQLLDAMPWDLNELNEEHENNLLNGME